jgi:hypothetical protein
MKRLLTVSALLGGLLAFPLGARAHCDAVDGPVATAAIKALDTNNVNLVLPYAPAEAEAELTGAFEQAVVVRAAGDSARALADRYFMETAVRLHRAGEHAPYTGLKPAGTDFGPAIPAAEAALGSGDLKPVLEVLAHQAALGAGNRFEHAMHMRAESDQPPTLAGVPAARARISAELEFIGYVESVYLATRSSAHADGEVTAHAD